MSFNLSNQIKDVSYEPFCFFVVVLANRKDDIFQLMFFIYRGDNCGKLASFTLCHSVFYFILPSEFTVFHFSPRSVLCQAKYIYLLITFYILGLITITASIINQTPVCPMCSTGTAKYCSALSSGFLLLLFFF